MEETAAQQSLAYSKVGLYTKNLKQVDAKIGDEAFFGDVASGDNSLSFRKGRFVVRLSISEPFAKPKTYTPDAILQKLIPLAQKIAGQL